MSLLPTCVVCDALLRGYNGDCLCARCKQPCPTCSGDVAYCQHPLPDENFGTEVHPDPLPNELRRVA